MDLFDLDDLIPNLGIDPSRKQLDELYAAFEKDFVLSQLTMFGLRVKIISALSDVEGFESYPETFVHLITRKSGGGKRVFDRHRANKIHWVRCILENRNEEDVSCFKYPEEDGTLRDYYWFKEGDFLVIMEKVAPDYLVITSFHIDDRRRREYFEGREKWYIQNKT